MSKAEKILWQMRNNPRDWRMDDLLTVAKRYGLDVRQSKGSHVTFSHPEVEQHLSIPAKTPIKPIYVESFVEFIDLVI